MSNTFLAILNFLVTGINSVVDWFYDLFDMSGVGLFVLAMFIFWCIYRFVFSPVFGHLKSGSSDQARKKKDDE